MYVEYWFTDPSWSDWLSCSEYSTSLPCSAFSASTSLVSSL